MKSPFYNDQPYIITERQKYYPPYFYNEQHYSTILNYEVPRVHKNMNYDSTQILYPIHRYNESPNMMENYMSPKFYSPKIYQEIIQDRNPLYPQQGYSKNVDLQRNYESQQRISQFKPSNQFIQQVKPKSPISNFSNIPSAVNYKEIVYTRPEVQNYNPGRASNPTYYHFKERHHGLPNYY